VTQLVRFDVGARDRLPDLERFRGRSYLKKNVELLLAVLSPETWPRIKDHLFPRR
jgi:hypothetical protein